MKDILGREIKDGDLCIGMAIGRNSHGMHIGVFQGSSVAYLSHNEKYINKSCTSNTYLIENPTEMELVIKNKVQKLLDEEENERKRKASMKTIPLSKLEVGGVYKTNNNLNYLYLGKRKVIIEDYHRGNGKKVEEGNCFVYVYDPQDVENLTKSITEVEFYNGMKPRIDILKGNKKLIELVNKIDLKFPIIEERKNKDGGFYWKDYHYKIIIE